MQYPEVLLPQQRFKCVTTDLSEHHLCRTSKTKDFINPVTERIKDEALCENPTEFFDYSTNHLGQFEHEHNYISFCGNDKKYFRLYWDFLSEVKQPNFNEDFIFDNSKGIFFLRIGDIHNNIHFPIKNSTQKDDSVTAIVKHTPSNSNFWHFSIRWVDQNGNEINVNDSKWKHPIIATIRASIQEIVILANPESIPISDENYIL
jgi:hypothetical protein